MARVLVIDDEESILELMSQFLATKNHEVFVASNGVKALNICRDYDIEVAFVDIFVQVMDGLEVIENLRQERPDIGIAAMSGGGRYNLNLLPKARALGAKMALHKPLLMEDILEAVNQVMEA